MADENTGRGRGGRGRRNTRLERRRQNDAAEPRETPEDEPRTEEQEQEPAAEAEPQEQEEQEEQEQQPAAEAEPQEQEEEPAAQAEPEEQDQEPAADAEPQEREPAAAEQQAPPSDAGRDGRARPRVSLSKVARIARVELQQLIGRPVTAVLGVEPRDGGRWEVQVETVELQRIPETTSVMGLYDVLLDDEGEILEFRRTRRYRRSQADDDS